MDSNEGSRKKLILDLGPSGASADSHAFVRTDSEFESENGVRYRAPSSGATESVDLGSPEKGDGGFLDVGVSHELVNKPGSAFRAGIPVLNHILVL